ncbi:unnamed protein product [Chondrus crispus]|uniref:Uncharacterized protein n=1 Tax=Chondrus crispus TaxID=2769 RepID=R7Q3H4_CHOCR|nr:unnamed protein product [Chondrus crispus]CDF33092.1 unnamed protein product [Chondrus crispus]|eukprot:XP_005712895.1 unnamed protein product [Chondrus crispus]
MCCSSALALSRLSSDAICRCGTAASAPAAVSPVDAPATTAGGEELRSGGRTSVGRLSLGTVESKCSATLVARGPISLSSRVGIAALKSRALPSPSLLSGSWLEIPWLPRLALFLLRATEGSPQSATVLVSEARPRRNRLLLRTGDSGSSSSLPHRRPTVIRQAETVVRRRT